MPAVTPNFAIPYPCPGDNVDCFDFNTWAEGIDSALAEVTQVAAQATLRPRAMLRTADTGTPIPVGVTTGISFNLAGGPVYNEGMDVGAFPHTAFRTFNPDYSGWYIFCAQFTPLTVVGSVTSFSATISVGNPAVLTGRTLASSAATTIAQPISLITMGRLDAFDPTSVAFCTWQWTGAGGPLSVYCQFSCQFMAAQ